MKLPQNLVPALQRTLDADLVFSSRYGEARRQRFLHRHAGPATQKALARKQQAHEQSVHHRRRKLAAEWATYPPARGVLQRRAK
jgi:hypothetical protein